MAKGEKTGGRTKTFKSGEMLVRLWREFCNEIVNNDYNIAPTYTEFSKWLEKDLGNVDIKTLYNSLYIYFLDSKKELEAIRADVIAQGTMLGKYTPAMSIFALKNWTGWTDKTENYNVNENVTIDFGDIQGDE